MERDILAFKAGANVSANQIVTWVNGVDGIVGASATDAVLLMAGITTDIAGSSGDTVDVIVGGVADLKLGGTVKVGEPVTTDSTGYGVKATPSTVALIQTVGFSLMDGVSGDIVPVKVAQGRLEKL